MHMHVRHVTQNESLILGGEQYFGNSASGARARVPVTQLVSQIAFLLPSITVVIYLDFWHHPTQADDHLIRYALKIQRRFRGMIGRKFMVNRASESMRILGPE